MGEASRIGEILAAKYRLDEELGRGGMGVVYRAFHLGVHKQFAVKVLNAEVAGRKKIAARLVLEAQAAGRIGHAGILDVYDVGEDDEGRPFLVMELLRGETLSSLIARGPLEPELASWVALKVLETLDAAHRAGVVHRDVKPGNVFLVTKGEAGRAGPRGIKLLDFGIAKFQLDADVSCITGTGEVMGSPLYMAPEQALGEVEIDARADVWSVGTMLFEMLTGKPAHIAPSAAAVIAKILTETPPSPSSRRGSIPRELDGLVRKALEIDREARYSSAKDMLDAVAEVRAALGWTDAAPSFPAEVRRIQAEQVVPKDRPSGRGERVSREPALESAVTAGNTTTSSPRSRRMGVVVAASLLAAGAAVPWAVWGGAEKPGAGARGNAGVNAEASAEADAKVKAKAEADAKAKAEADAKAKAKAEAEAEADAAVHAKTDAGASTGAPDAARAASGGGQGAAVAKPCPANEVMSAGHCCPTGQAWQAGRCERPIATSF